MVEGKHPHLVMIPFMAQGHFNGFISLATLILEHHPSTTITIVTTKLNTPNLLSKLPPSNNIHVASLPFDPVKHDLPVDGYNTDVLNYPLIVRLFHASTTLRPDFEDLLANISNADNNQPLCVISDAFFGWTFEVAQKLGVFHILFPTFGAYGMAMYFSIWLHLPHAKTDADEFDLPDFPDIKLHRSQLASFTKKADGTDSLSLFLQPQIRFCLKSSGVLVNTVEEMEVMGVSQLRSLFGKEKPIWCIGPLIPPSLLTDSFSHEAVNEKYRKNSGISSEDAAKWLDNHTPRSVLYISFGSQNTISASQMKELALGLEDSAVPFIWVIRPPIEIPTGQEFELHEWLPEGFEDRMQKNNKGLVVCRWAPQLSILTHPSAGGFLSHCGWNSVLEALSQGLPIIGWPIAGEQFYNSKMLEEELDVCVELARGNETEVKRKDVCNLVSLVMRDTKKRGEMMKKAEEVKGIMRSSSTIAGKNKVNIGSSISSLNDFMNTCITKGERLVTPN